MEFSLTDEQYARARISESPLRSLSSHSIKPFEETSMPVLDSYTYKNIQSVVAELMVMVAKDTVVPLRQIAEVIKTEADNIAAAGLDYAYNIIATNQQEEELEVEAELEESDDDPDVGDWVDRKEDEEEETRAAN